MLEVGCGPANLWLNNSKRIPEDVSITLGDLSVGMVVEARQNTATSPTTEYLCLDAQSIPTSQNVFDLVIANHMLYHVSDICIALDEIGSVLKPGGRLCTATNGIDHMRELHELIQKFNPDHLFQSSALGRFTLENAIEQMNDYFARVELRIYNDHLQITEVEPLMAYILSLSSLADINSVDSNNINSIESYLVEEIDSTGYIFITKSQGMLVGYL